AALDVQIADAQRREAILAKRIEAERAQLQQLARAIYVSPGSALLVLAESQSLSDLLTRVSDLNAAGARAAEIKSALARDLDALQKEREPLDPVPLHLAGAAGADLPAFRPQHVLVRAAVRQLPALPHRHRPGGPLRLARLRSRRRHRGAGRRHEQRLWQLRRGRALG